MEASKVKPFFVKGNVILFGTLNHRVPNTIGVIVKGKIESFAGAAKGGFAAKTATRAGASISKGVSTDCDPVATLALAEPHRVPVGVAPSRLQNE